ncbi:imidazole glycerol phosphate synthase subunit HisH [Cochleicola gelatinilyticus]|uniref:Imidazole glycerol phosphate synthase subunit HisH n=1 Tax=Cochleicola gelatinilyticus TaxID=1763537 RepID=A0A167H008_9FLAO|nr:imidazole glycerol phosphate synthase subunit HisH [Cochleicola gelatinilyticus]OAB78072.1 imidazole glycerol phosphate synthase subunit HisH [Cochleicola gelatinilyticus]
MKIAIIDYGAGNIKSLQFAIARLGYTAELTKSVAVLRNADRVIFPGVGEAGNAMQKLRESGLHTIIPTLKQPVLGICLGMQLMCNSSEEGKTKGLGIFNTEVIKFSNNVKVPQVGWNTIKALKTDLFQGISENEYMYLVHSYYAPNCPEAIAVTEYDNLYASALRKDNFFGVQFHPEKSSTAGELLLKNFIEIPNL